MFLIQFLYNPNFPNFPCAHIPTEKMGDFWVPFPVAKGGLASLDTVAGGDIETTSQDPTDLDGPVGPGPWDGPWKLSMGRFVLNKKAAGWAFNDGKDEAAFPRVKSAPMGWSNVVDFVQSGLECMGTQAGMSIKHAIRMGEALPALPLDTPRTYYSWYVDNWDSFKIIAQSAAGEYEGQPSDEQLKLRHVFQVDEKMGNFLKQ
jgi:hypothetical protein